MLKNAHFYDFLQRLLVYKYRGFKEKDKAAPFSYAANKNDVKPC